MALVRFRGGLLAVVLTVGAADTVLAARTAGDPVRGHQLYEARCGACHSLDEDRVGPHHRDVVGRKAGSVPGFAYSKALARSKLTWTEANLDRWLKNPEALVKGQAMNFQVPVAADRADIIAYLKEAAGRGPAPPP